MSQNLADGSRTIFLCKTVGFQRVVLNLAYFSPFNSTFGIFKVQKNFVVGLLPIIPPTDAHWKDVLNVLYLLSEF